MDWNDRGSESGIKEENNARQLLGSVYSLAQNSELP
jgi:hypothetical protein